jgi:hypothetical protein
LISSQTNHESVQEATESPVTDKAKKAAGKSTVENASQSSKGIDKHVSGSSSSKRPKSSTSEKTHVGAPGEGGKHASPIASRLNSEQKAKPRKDKVKYEV